MNNETNSLSYVKKNINMIFRNGKATEHELIAGLMTDAIVQGVTKLSAEKIEGWWVVTGLFDWTKSNDRGLTDWVEIFSTLISNNKIGPTSSRSEIIVHAFSEGVWVFDCDTNESVSFGIEVPDSVKIMASDKKSFVVAFCV